MQDENKYYRGTYQPWMERASCLGLSFAFDKTAWGLGSTGRKYKRQCRRVCDNCPVKDQCLEWALDMDNLRVPLPQMAGGLTFDERQELAR